MDGLVVHEVVAEHVTHDEVPILNTTHVRFGNANLQLGHRTELAAVTTGQRDRLAAYRIRIFHRAEYIRRITRATDCDEHVFRFREVFQLFGKNAVVAYVVRIGGNSGEGIGECHNAEPRLAVVAGALDHVTDEMRSSGCAPAVPANENVTIGITRSREYLNGASDRLRVNRVKRGYQLRFILQAEVQSRGLRSDISHQLNRTANVDEKLSIEVPRRAFLRKDQTREMCHNRGGVGSTCMRQEQRSVKIGKKRIGDDQPCYVIAEIGINHNGDIDLAKRLISVAVAAGCDAVKFQKRSIDVVYTPEELAKPRESPFGNTNGDLKRGLEFGQEEYEDIDAYCKAVQIDWFASCWDEQSVDFINQFDVPCFKIASASLTDDNLLRHTRASGKPLILSTGMSTLEEIDHAVDVLGKENLVLLHACSTYPALYEELNLRAIPKLRERYELPVGYSGHETGIPSTVAAVVLGSCCVERHITLDRAMWGSDHAASLEPNGITRVVRDIRLIEQSLGDGEKRVYEREYPIIKKLRRVGAAPVPA